MPKRRTKLQKISDQYDAFRAMRIGVKPHRICHKDGSVPTKPIVPVEPLPEYKVLDECRTWLRTRGFIADRMNVGVGDIGSGEMRTYGIIGAGDLLVIAPNGLHIEIECKKGLGGSWSLSQQKRCKKIRRNNAVYMIVHGTPELEHRFKAEGLI